jgi:hypothetical protein
MQIGRGSADYLVKVLLNEKEMALPVPTQHAPYYKWQEVKKFYLKKIQIIEEEDVSSRK